MGVLIWVLIILIIIAIGIGIYFMLSGDGSAVLSGISGGNSVPSPPALPSE
ncbi:MAG: hypothetical protein AABW79_03550 [Nanoarchaeota archaeon]